MLGEVPFDHPIQTIWQFITEPAKISHCVPGIIGWEEKIPQKKFLLSLTWISHTKTNIIIPTTLTWDSVSPPHQLQLTAIATPATLTPIKLEGQIDLLAKSANETLLKFTAVVQTPNPFLNQLVKNILPQQTERFFRCLKTTLLKPSPQ